MGGQGAKQTAQPAPPRDPMDMLLDVRMAKKRLQMESKKAEKEQEKNIQKAKEALKKNNEEGAKLFLQTATQKKQESVNLMKMATKLEAVEIQVKSAQANAAMIQSLTQVTPLMAQYTNNMSTEDLYRNLTNFENAIDDLTVQDKLMNQMLNKDDAQTNASVEAMMNQMRQENLAQLNQLNPQNLNQFQALQPQQQYQQQQQQQQYQK